MTINRNTVLAGIVLAVVIILFIIGHITPHVLLGLIGILALIFII